MNNELEMLWKEIALSYFKVKQSSPTTHHAGVRRDKMRMWKEISGFSLHHITHYVEEM
jgi:hypothetical protein